MKANHLLLVLIVFSFSGACKSSKASKKPAAVWINKDKVQGKTFDSIFIVVLTANIEARVKLEKDLAAAAESRGFKTVKSIDVMPVSLDDPKRPEKEDVVKHVKASGCDGVLISALLDKTDEVHYKKGSTVYTVTPYYSFYSYSGYYGYYNNTVTHKSSYTDNKRYFMLSNFYDAASEEIMWSVQSEILNPSSLEKFSQTYMWSLITQLEKAGFMKKKE